MIQHMSPQMLLFVWWKHQSGYLSDWVTAYICSHLLQNSGIIGSDLSANCIMWAVGNVDTCFSYRVWTVVFHVANEMGCAWLELILYISRHQHVQELYSLFAWSCNVKIVNKYLYICDCFQNFIANVIHAFQVLASENATSCEVILIISKVLLDVWWSQ